MFEDPSEEEYPSVPVKLKNNFFTQGLNMVTNMYSLPQYGTVDPNPLMAPFFILFYGLMMADMGYGLLMIVCPTYALIPLSMHILHIDYFTCYPALLVLLLGVYMMGRKRAEKIEAKKQAMKAMSQKVGEKVEDAQKIDEGEIPEAARAAAEAMRAAAAQKAAQQQTTEE